MLTLAFGACAAGLDHSGRTRTSKSAQRYTVAGRAVAEQSEESSPYTLHYGWVCQAGFYPEDMNKKNQDNLLVHTNFDVSETVCVSVCVRARASAASGTCAPNRRVPLVLAQRTCALAPCSVSSTATGASARSARRMP